MDKKHLLIDNEITTFFKEKKLDLLYSKLNIIVSMLTDYDEKELVMLSKSKNNNDDELSTSITICCVGLTSNRIFLIKIRFAYITNDQLNMLNNSILVVDEFDGDTITEYSLAINELETKIHKRIQISKKDENLDKAYIYRIPENY